MCFWIREILALDDLNTTLALSPDLYDALQLRSQIYDEKGEYESAIADYQKMYELDSTQKDVLMYIGRLLSAAAGL